VAHGGEVLAGGTGLIAIEGSGALLEHSKAPVVFDEGSDDGGEGECGWTLGAGNGGEERGPELCELLAGLLDVGFEDLFRSLRHGGVLPFAMDLIEWSDGSNGSSNDLRARWF
jgi:hypothetical protein